jgi:hypothetical protein
MNLLALIPMVNPRMMGGKTEYLEIQVDGVPLQQLFAGRLGSWPDRISPLGWRVPDVELYIKEQFQRFLLLAPPNLPDERNSILVCPLDGDLGCGAYSARFTRKGQQMIWSEFGYENNYDPESVDLETYKHIGPLTFDWAQYEKELLHHCPDLV